MSTAIVREIFTSIQGEGTHIGEKQIFVRFCGCNLNCEYCDTDFNPNFSKEYSVDTLVNKIRSFQDTQTISLTGGEPLVSVNFLKDFLPEIKKYNHKIYLETNGTLPEQLQEIIEFVDIVAADIKIESATKQKPNIDSIEKFLKIASKKEVFAKIVFDENITDYEIEFTTDMCKKYNIEIILQPKMTENKPSVSSKVCEIILDKFYSKYKKVRLIPQMHKFLDIH